MTPNLEVQRARDISDKARRSEVEEGVASGHDRCQYPGKSQPGEDRGRELSEENWKGLVRRVERRELTPSAEGECREAYTGHQEHG